MPTYEYACADCGPFDALRALALRNEACPCPTCAAPAARVFLSAPRLTCMSGERRQAFETNERSSHAPVSTRAGDYSRLRHPAGCGCCSTGSKRSSTVQASDGTKSMLGKRPWMISH